MPTRSAPTQPPAAQSGRTLVLPDADLVSAAWLDYSAAAGLPTPPDMAKTLSFAMLALGFALALFVPLGAALLLLAGVVGLTIASSPIN